MNQTILAKPEPTAFFRWTVLVFISLAMFGNYYVYDSISPLADLLVKQLKFSDTNIGLLQGIYSIPNIFMVLIGGLIIDRIGTKKANLIFSTLCLLGALYTVVKGDILFMATGRLIFGLGAESLIVSITTTLARWFKGKELSFAFGLNLTIARLGSFAALNSPSWGKSLYANWQDPLFVALGAAGISVVSVIIYFVLDSIAEKKFEIKPEGNQDKIIWGDLLKFSKSYWFITALCVVFYSAMFPFQTFAVKFFMEVHGTSRELGGFLSSILTLSAMIMTPLFGLLADKIGKRASLMMLGSLLIIPVYLIMAYTKVNLYIPMSIMGIAFSLIPAIMWPSVALIVKDSKLGTAYGLMTMIQNIGLAGFNLLIGTVNDATGSYTTGMWLFSSLGFFGLLFAYLLKKSDKGPNGFGLEKANLNN
jgi:MFS family permease